ncbi:MAG: proline iminopeptidase-family hydrolase [Alphaproteobacteria bacterium]
MRFLVLAIVLMLAGCAQNLSTYQVPNVPSKEGFVKTDNGQLYYQTMGQGDPVIVIHGGPGMDQGYLLPGMAALAQKHQVVFYDQLGCGRSAATVIDESHITINSFVEDIETLRKALKFEKVTIVGHSWGGMLAMYYAVKYPKNIKKLVLMNTVTSAGMEEFLDEVEKRTMPSAGEFEKLKASQEFIDSDPQAIAQYYRLFFQYYFHNPKDLEKLNLQLEPKGAATGVKVAKILEESIFGKYTDQHDDLQKLKIPTLIIRGESDVIPMSAANSMAHSIKGSKLVVLKNCGHFPYIEQPAQWLEAVEMFLK